MVLKTICTYPRHGTGRGPYIANTTQEIVRAYRRRNGVDLSQFDGSARMGPTFGAMLLCKLSFIHLYILQSVMDLSSS
ncbi:uncharacterized protein PGTG_07370 [Puccinia graminis f. sp. tritici CRL 75-36-700-3]|uniref:Uncharacterized protein n=1 Tax=Puccinia graminis f. sp. tritici (strain CRL 75-36-700-3 / race SCCL) TaxID=418459 RepID=E3K9M2_PUCGT|nr:uncharacterized protein PGTG_07370 [Puccinia graminis f. sp. tritici CRL 75-36-700-3]EFP81118.2 hypothetical protein PGTG_07370 [Puccinia graminis f. sp. tritici CRL 75-36-700-3]